jgi:hypothetical protein
MFNYELKFKTIGYPWKVFDTYKTINDPDLRKYHALLRKSEFNGGVKVVKIEIIRTEVKIN